MELLSVIRRWHHRNRCSIREISRRSGPSRNIVRKYLRADSVEPRFHVPDLPSKLDPYADKLAAMLRVCRAPLSDTSGYGPMASSYCLPPYR